MRRIGRTDTPPPGARLFVYGSLKRGGPAHGRLLPGRATAFLGPARARGRLVDLGAYPGLVEGEGVVAGELYAVRAPGLWSELDAFELFDPDAPDPFDPETGEGSEFVRIRTRLLRPALTAFLYRFNGPAQGARTMRGGHWPVTTQRPGL